mmetsp:Transcript_129353/g.322473  ORF Transcript_129353/g.322473 Transcript_129353/m.322473 type:complete len:664 (-) Transcript_129353:29-2020(-)
MELPEVGLPARRKSFREGTPPVFGDKGYATSQSAPLPWDGGADNGNGDDFFAELVNRVAPPRRARTTRVFPGAADIIAASKLECTKCDSLNAKFMEEKRKAFLETEHLRRGLEKMLEACSAVMTDSALSQLQDSLQLNVRYLTKPPDEVEGQAVKGGRPAQAASGSSNCLVEKLKQQIVGLEEEIKTLNLRLQQNNKKEEPGAIVPGRGRGAAPGSSAGVITATTMSQTDPVEFARPGDGSLGGGVGKSGKATAGSPTKSERGGGAREIQETEVIDPVTGKSRPRRPDDPPPTVTARQSRERNVEGPHHAEDHSADLEKKDRELARLQSAHDLLEMKLTSAEKAKSRAEEAAKRLEGLLKERDEAAAQEAAAWKKKMDDQLKLVNALEKQLAQQGGAPTNEGPRQGATTSGGSQPSSNKKTKKKKGADIPVAGKKGITKRQLITDDSPGRAGASAEGSTGGGGDEGGHAEGEEAEEGSEDDDEDSGPELVDACVGNGPGPGLFDEPVRCRGSRAPGLPREMNKHGKVYMREIRSFPNLHSTTGSLLGSSRCAAGSTARSGRTGAVSLASAEDASAPGASRSIGMASTRSSTSGLPCVASAASLAAQAAAAAAHGSAGDPEPYLLHLWKQKQTSNRQQQQQPCERELRILGAFQSGGGLDPSRS